MGLKLGVFGFVPITHAKTYVKQMRPLSSRAVRLFTRVYLHAQTAVDAGDIRTWWTTVILITGKLEDPQFEPHAGIKMAQVLGCPLYICGWSPFVHDKSEIRDTACAMKLTNTRGVLECLIKKSMAQRN